ncbi:hypothetical protein K0M31_018180, partial [Melipona bicolor]
MEFEETEHRVQQFERFAATHESVQIFGNFINATSVAQLSRSYRSSLKRIQKLLVRGMPDTRVSTNIRAHFTLPNLDQSTSSIDRRTDTTKRSFKGHLKSPRDNAQYIRVTQIHLPETKLFNS